MGTFFMNTVAVLVSLAAATTAATECDDWQNQHPEWVWCDDFEATTALDTRYEDVSTNGMGQSTDDAFSGQASLKQSYTSGQVDAGWVIKVQNSGFPDHIFYRYYHKFGPGYTRYPPKMARIGYRVRSGSWQPTFMVHTWLNTSNSEVTLDVLARNSSQANPSGWLPVRNSGVRLSDFPDRWVAVEVEVQLNTPGSTDGIYRLWIDDTLVVEALNVDLRGATSDRINEIMLDTYWNGGADGDRERFYDNFVISTQRIGLADTSGGGSPPPNMCETPNSRNLIKDPGR